jgi:predicted nucleic acid-binding protein
LRLTDAAPLAKGRVASDAGPAFVDTDIRVYAHLKAPGDQRHERALALVQGRGDLVISPQVVAEYCSAMLHNVCVIDPLRDDLA